VSRKQIQAEVDPRKGRKAKELYHGAPREELTLEAQAIERTFWILPKKGPRLRFKLNPSQKAYDLIRGPRDIITKARQKGFSSLGIAYQTIDCLGKEGTRAVLISHEAKSTQRLLDRARFYLNYMSIDYEVKDYETGEVLGTQDVPLHVDLGRHSRQEFYFPQTESTFYIGTAGSRAFGRGDTVTHLHISEYAWWETDALKQVSGLFQSVPLDGTIRIESTGNGKYNDFYYMVVNAKELGYQVFFRGWWQDPEYQLQPTGDWAPQGFEEYFQDIQSKYNLTPQQLYWYWRKLLEFRLNLTLMQQEYPSSIEECFQASGSSVFPEVEGYPNSNWKWKRESKYNYRVDYDEAHPKEGMTYVLGADAAGGTGNDEAAIQILSLETFEQVYEFGSNRCDPVEFGRFTVDLANRYNQCYVVHESNNHGITVDSILRESYRTDRLYLRKLPTRRTRAEYGYYTGETTKKALAGVLLQAFDLGLILYGESTLDEIYEFEEDSHGRMGGPQDGKVIGLALACVGYFKWVNLIRVVQAPKPKPVIDYENCSFLYDPYEWMMEAASAAKGRTKAFPDMLNRRY
jgi:hypothetical protein